MDKQILLLAARMLEIASDEFSNHGCNDLDDETINLITDESNLCKEIEKWNGDDGYPPNIKCIPDWMLMRFLKDKLKGAAQ